MNFGSINGSRMSYGTLDISTMDIKPIEMQYIVVVQHIVAREQWLYEDTIYAHSTAVYKRYSRWSVEEHASVHGDTLP